MQNVQHMVTNSFPTPPLPVKQNKYAKLEHIASFSFFSPLVVAGNESARVYARVLIEISNGIDKRCMFIEVYCFLWGISHVFCCSEDLFRADLRGERKSDTQPPFSSLLPKNKN